MHCPNSISHFDKNSNYITLRRISYILIDSQYDKHPVLIKKSITEFHS